MGGRPVLGDVLIPAAAVLPGRAGGKTQAGHGARAIHVRRAAPSTCAFARIFRPALRVHLTGQCLDSSEFEGLANTT